MTLALMCASVKVFKRLYLLIHYWLAFLGQLDVCSIGDQEVAGSAPLGWHHSFVEIDHEILSMVILSNPPIQDGQLSISGERMCTILVNRLED